jgi:predicted permease
MAWLSESWRRLAALLRHNQMNTDLEQEMRLHVELRAQQQAERGSELGEAHYIAQRMFGNTLQLKERSRDVWQWRPIEELSQDLRFAFRMMRRSPGFTAVAVVSLALGIGANTAIFSLLNAILLRPLPVRSPEQLVQFNRWFGTQENSYFPYPHFERFKRSNRTLSGMFAVTGWGRIGLSYRGQSELANAELVSGDYYPVLGVTPLLGRVLTPEDDRPDNAIAVMSYAYWQRRFGGDRSVVGATVTLNGKPFVIVGVTPPEFFGVKLGDSNDVTLPLRTIDLVASGDSMWDQPFSTWLLIIGRLKPGVTRQKAQGELNGICQQFQTEVVKQAPPEDRGSAARWAREVRLELLPATNGIKGNLHQFAGSLTILMLVVGIALLIACANLASLMLARAVSRHKEIALRLAIGAARFRLIRQLLTESLLLSVSGGAAGVLLAFFGARALVAMISSGAPIDLTPDLRILIFTAAVSLATGILFGVAPALRATKLSLSPALKESSGMRSGRRMLDRILVAGEVALSLVLLAGAGLFVRTLQNLWNVNAGYNRENVLMFSADPHHAGQSGTGMVAIYRELLSKIETIPGARSVSLSVVRPIDDEAYFVGLIRSIDGRELPEDRNIRVATNYVGPGYFATLNTPILLGREFSQKDNESSPKVAIISETFAHKAFPKENPIGRRIGGNAGRTSEDFEIVGVARDVRYGDLRDSPRSVLYMAFFQHSGDYGATVEIRYTGGVSALLDQVRAKIRSVDRNLPIFRVKTLDVQARESLARERLMAMLSSLFGILALALASIGLYGLMAYSVTRRTKDIGIRMALGAQQAQVTRLVLRETLLLIAIGVTIGVPAAIAATRLISSILFGVKPTDPTTYAVAASILLLVAGLAGYLPARRASRIDPIVALHYE